MSSKDALSVGIGENVFVSVATDAVNMRMLDLAPCEARLDLVAAVR